MEAYEKMLSLSRVPDEVGTTQGRGRDPETRSAGLSSGTRREPSHP